MSLLQHMRMKICITVATSLVFIGDSVAGPIGKAVQCPVQNGYELRENSGTCCKPVTCEKQHGYKLCSGSTSAPGQDTCYRCPIDKPVSPGMYTGLDNDGAANYGQIEICMEVDCMCPKGSELQNANKCQEEGQAKRCECSRKLGYYGDDPLLCNEVNSTILKLIQRRGYELLQTGEVRMCGKGTFKSLSDNSSCIPHSRCGVGYEVDFKGNTTNDATCKPSPTKSVTTTVHTHVVNTTTNNDNVTKHPDSDTDQENDNSHNVVLIVIVIVVVVFLVCLVSGIILWYRWKKRKNLKHLITDLVSTKFSCCRNAGHSTSNVSKNETGELDNKKNDTVSNGRLENFSEDEIGEQVSMGNGKVPNCRSEDFSEDQIGEQVSMGNGTLPNSRSEDFSEDEIGEEVSMGNSSVPNSRLEDLSSEETKPLLSEGRVTATNKASNKNEEVQNMAITNIQPSVHIEGNNNNFTINYFNNTTPESSSEGQDAALNMNERNSEESFLTMEQYDECYSGYPSKKIKAVPVSIVHPNQHSPQVCEEDLNIQNRQDDTSAPLSHGSNSLVLPFGSIGLDLTISSDGSTSDNLEGYRERSIEVEQPPTSGNLPSDYRSKEHDSVNEETDLKQVAQSDDTVPKEFDEN